MKHIKELDSLRAIAVIMVITSHWFPAKNSLYKYSTLFNGVDIFFVLSGFLITGILLKNREDAEKYGIARTSVFKNFFIRRTIRIFPIYYLYITILYIFGSSATDTHIREDFIYHATYISNIHFYMIQDWDGTLSHLWSLAVEEQFYLIWPWVILLTSRRYLVQAILLFIVIGLISRMFYDDEYFFGILTFTCFDAFGAGAILSWISLYSKPRLSKYYPLLTFLAITAICLQVQNFSTNSMAFYYDKRACTSLFTLWLITTILLKKHKKFTIISFILENRIFLFIGKISYGVYLYHLFIPKYLKPYLTSLNTYLPKQFDSNKFYIIRLEYFLLVVGVSWLSWHLIERPLLRLKKQYEFKPQLSPQIAQDKVHMTMQKPASISQEL